MSALEAGRRGESCWTDRVSASERFVAAYMSEQRAYRRLNARLNASEKRLRNRIGICQVSALIRQFKDDAADDPLLYAALYTKRDPYRWLAEQWAASRSP